MKNNNVIVPFVKWAGGKRQHIESLKKYSPKKFNTYFEPFLGGGAFLFALKPDKAYISDLNSELINAYNVIKHSYKRLREYLILMEYGHNKKFYEKIRKIDRNDIKNDKDLNLSDSKILRASRFIYLNKASFNGLYRVNSSGYFNVPWNQKEKIKIFDYPNIEKISNYLSNKNIYIKNISFEKIYKYSKRNDFIYFDPPYDYDEGVVGFTSYQKNGFGQDKQKELYELCMKLHRKGVKWMVSNHKTKLIQNLYSEFKIRIIDSKRLIGGKGASRKNVKEVLITNY